MHWSYFLSTRILQIVYIEDESVRKAFFPPLQSLNLLVLGHYP